MLKVLPIQTKSEQEALCIRCAVPFHVDLMAYGASIDGRDVGICQFTMNASGGYLYHLALVKDADISTQDQTEALFVLGRATLNFIDLCGVHKAYFEDRSFLDETMIRAIGFRRDGDGRWFMDLTDFFKSPCQHDKHE
jgi:hypothetical protein